MRCAILLLVLIHPLGDEIDDVLLLGLELEGFEAKWALILAHL